MFPGPQGSSSQSDPRALPELQPPGALEGNRGMVSNEETKAQSGAKSRLRWGSLSPLPPSGRERPPPRVFQALTPFTAPQKWPQPGCPACRPMRTSEEEGIISSLSICTLPQAFKNHSPLAGETFDQRGLQRPKHGESGRAGAGALHPCPLLSGLPALSTPLPFSLCLSLSFLLPLILHLLPSSLALISDCPRPGLGPQSS